MNVMVNPRVALLVSLKICEITDPMNINAVAGIFFVCQRDNQNTVVLILRYGQ